MIFFLSVVYKQSDKSNMYMLKAYCLEQQSLYQSNVVELNKLLHAQNKRVLDSDFNEKKDICLQEKASRLK